MSTTRGPFRPIISVELATEDLTKALARAQHLDKHFNTPESAHAVEQIRLAILAMGRVVKE